MIRADDLTEARRVDVRHAFQIEHELLLAAGEQAVDLVLQQLVAFAKGHLALQIEHGDIAHRPFRDFHARYPRKLG